MKENMWERLQYGIQSLPLTVIVRVSGPTSERPSYAYINMSYDDTLCSIKSSVALTLPSVKRSIFIST